MALYYRLTIYQERALQSNLVTEPDVLTADGTVHSDPFQVATASGVSGFQPYLELPEGRTAKLDERERKTDQGEMTFTLLDARTGTSNLSRWVTGFLAILKPGCKVVCEESSDLSSWTDWWTGRVEAVRLDGRVALTIRCRDMLGDLARHEAFVGRPEASISYAGEPLLLPLGRSVAFGPEPAVTAMSGTISSDGIYRTISLSSASRGRADNVVTAALLRSAGIPLGKVSAPIEVRASENLRARFSAGAVTAREAVVVKLEVVRRSSGRYQVNKLWLRATDTSDPFYTALDTGTIADAAAVTSLTVRQLSLREAGGEAPLLLDNIRGPQLIADLLDGYFGRLDSAGDPERSFPYDSASFTALIADDSFPALRFVITEPVKLKTWVEEQVLRVSGLGWRVNASGEIVLLDLRPPRAVPSVDTITEADLADGTVPDWEYSRDEYVGIVVVKTYLDEDVDADELGSARIPNAPTALLESVAVPRIIQVGDNLDLGVSAITIDAQGLRTFPDEEVENEERSQRIAREANQIAAHLRPFGGPRIRVTLQCARTANTDCEVGDWRLIDVDALPDPTTQLRGGTRLMRCVERTDQPKRGLVRRLRFADAGPTNVAVAPTVATPAQESSNTQHGLTVAVTLNASGQPARLWVCTTATSVGSRPADSDPGWRLVTPIGLVGPYLYSSTTYTVRPLAAGLRHWVAVETGPVVNTCLGSPRAYPAGTGYVDSATLTAPTTLTVGSVSTKSALAEWDNAGDDTSTVELWLASGATKVAADAATPVRYKILPPGTEAYQLTGLDTTLPELGTAGPWYRLQVRHADRYGGVSSAAALAATSFEATGAATTAPVPAAILVLRDSVKSPLPGGGHRPLGAAGIEVQFVLPSTGLGLNLEIERAPDSGGSPGSWVAVQTFAQVTSRAVRFRDKLGAGTGPWWYRARLSGAGVSAGSYLTAAAALSPGWLPNQVFGTDDPGELVLGETETLLVPAAAFVAESETEDYALLGTYLSPGTVNVSLQAYAAVVLPPGATITAVAMRAYRADTSDTCEVILRSAVDGSGSAITGTIAHTGTGWHTDDDTGLAYAVADDEQLYLDLLMNTNIGSAASTEARLAYVAVSYTRSSYRQR